MFESKGPVRRSLAWGWKKDGCNRRLSKIQNLPAASRSSPASVIVATSVIVSTFIYKFPSRKSAMPAFPCRFYCDQRENIESLKGYWAVFLEVSRNVAFDAMYVLWHGRVRRCATSAPAGCSKSAPPRDKDTSEVNLFRAQLFTTSPTIA